LERRKKTPRRKRRLDKADPEAFVISSAMTGQVAMQAYRHATAPAKELTTPVRVETKPHCCPQYSIAIAARDIVTYEEHARGKVD
jgi:hypothetical protein